MKHDKKKKKNGIKSDAIKAESKKITTKRMHASGRLNDKMGPYEASIRQSDKEAVQRRKDYDASRKKR